MRLPLLVLAALCVSSLAARADTLTYTITSSFDGGGSADGFVTLDNVTGNFTQASLTVAGFPADDGPYSEIFAQGYNQPGYELNVGDASGNQELEITFSPASFVGYHASTIEFDGPIYFNIGNGGSSSLSASATLQSAVTPELPSIALLSTGLLGLAGVVRRRFGRVAHS